MLIVVHNNVLRPLKVIYAPTNLALSGEWFRIPVFPGKSDSVPLEDTPPKLEYAYEITIVPIPVRIREPRFPGDPDGKRYIYYVTKDTEEYLRYARSYARELFQF